MNGIVKLTVFLLALVTGFSLLLGLLRTVDASLTLPGIAGLVVAIVMAVDACKVLPASTADGAAPQ